MKKNYLLFLSIVFVFFLSGCSSAKNDPFEGYNRFMYKTNKSVDKYTLKPLAEGYQYITPDFIEKGVSNFFSNLFDINVTINSLLQGKFQKAGLASSRLVWNTTLGIGGLFDVASGMGIEKQNEDLGQTFRYWGIPAGPYFVIPFLGPSTITDGVGIIGDFYMSPISYWDWTDYRIANFVYVLGIVNVRANLLSLDRLLNDTPLDEYTFVKNSYLQRRESLTRDGKESKQTQEDFDQLFEDQESGN